MSTLHAAWLVSPGSSEFSLLQILIFGVFCAASAAFVTAVAGAARRASLRYQLRMAKRGEQRASHLLELFQDNSRATSRWSKTGTYLGPD
jgi:hypothetical protein